MAVSRISGSDGSVTMVTGHDADYASWRLRADQPVDDDTSYTDTTVGASHNGCGTYTYTFSASGFLKANVASTAPGLATCAGTGAAMTLQSKTGCTHAGSGIVSSIEISNAKRLGACPISIDGVIDGVVTETWAVA